jgi:superfamily II DNA or RNA helicase
MKILHRGTLSKLEDAPEDLEKLLYNTFVWQSAIDLNDERYFYKDGIMYRGIAEEVHYVCTNFGYECTLEDPPRVAPENNWHFLWEYRELQEEAVDVMWENPFGILKAPPGSGKTVMMSALVCRFGVQTAILVQNQEPFRQAYDTLCASTDIGEVGRIGLGCKEPSTVSVVMIQTLSQELQKNPDGEVATWWKGVKALFVDECHHAVSDAYLFALSEADNVIYQISVSATPHRDDERGDWILPLLGPVRHAITFKEQIDTGNLCPLTVFVQPVPEKVYGFVRDGIGSTARTKKQAGEQYKAVYDDYVIEGSTGRNQMCVEFVRAANAKGLTVAVIVSRVEHALEISKLLPEATVITGGDKKSYRTEVLDQLHHREIKCIISTLLDEAVDVPSLDAVAIMAGGRSSVKVEQRIRSTRSFEGDLRTGYYKKTRGFLFYPRDRADFLRSQSTEMIKILTKIVNEHPEANSLEELEEYEFDGTG